MPRKQPLNPRTERRRKQQEKQCETSPDRSRRLHNLRTRNKQRRELESEDHRSQRLLEERLSRSSDPVSVKRLRQQHNQRRQAIVRKRMKDRLPLSDKNTRILRSDKEVNHSAIDLMNNYCQYCGTKLFSSEITGNSPLICCHNWEIKLEPVEIPCS